MEFQFSASDLIKSGRITQESIDQIREWLIDNNLPKISDEFITIFLVSCDSNISNTAKTIEAYFRTKNNAPEIFTNMDIDQPDLKACMETVSMIPLPIRTEEGHIITFSRLEDSSYSKFNFVSQCKISCMLLDVHMQKYPPEGIITIIDMKNFSWRMFPKVKYGVLARLMQYAQEGMPLKIHQIHIMNCNFLINHIMSLMKLCVKSELFQKFRLHFPNMDREQFFRDHIPAKYMPSDYGGELPSVEELQKTAIQQLRDLKPFLEAEAAIRREYGNH